MASILTKSVILAFFAYQAAALPAPAGVDNWSGDTYTDPGIKFQPKDQNMAYCNWSKDMTKTTNERSPRVADCLQLVDKLESTPGDFAATNFLGAEIGDTKIIAQYGTCAFGVRPAHAEEMEDKSKIYWVGNLDARSILRYIITNYPVGYSDGTGRVQANGRMGCETAKGVLGLWRNVAWDVFDPKTGVQRNWGCSSKGC